MGTSMSPTCFAILSDRVRPIHCNIAAVEAPGPDIPLSRMFVLRRMSRPPSTCRPADDGPGTCTSKACGPMARLPKPREA